MDSAEHVWIGEQIELEFASGKLPAKGLQLQLTEPGTGRQTITYGQGIALGGDFYGIPDAPISTAADPQGLAGQITRLERAGAWVLPSNAQAARAAACIAGPDRVMNALLTENSP